MVQGVRQKGMVKRVGPKESVAKCVQLPSFYGDVHDARDMWTLGMGCTGHGVNGTKRGDVHRSQMRTFGSQDNWSNWEILTKQPAKNRTAPPDLSN